MMPATSQPEDGYKQLDQAWNIARDVDKDDKDSLKNVAWGFWHAGNTLDTFMDYYGRKRPDGYQGLAISRTQDAIGVFKDAVGVDPLNPDKVPTGAWWDDYGWWGLAFLKAAEVTNSERYQQCARHCWDFMEFA